MGKLLAADASWEAANVCLQTHGGFGFAEEYDIVDNLLWANDYPHHEGSWPHSAEAIERTLGNHLSETSRAKMLGLNAARIFRFDFS